MKIFLYSTANLGDFMNAYPILSGLAKIQPIDLVIRHEMSKFIHFKEFLFYQAIFNTVYYNNETVTEDALKLSSWTHMTRNHPNRPIETCRYENWMREKFKIDFEVDDDCELQVPDLDIDFYPEKFIVGDRWGVSEDSDLDQRRKSYVVRDGSSVDPNRLVYLDYTRSIFENCVIIKNNPNPFITTFTGIGIIADLMRKPTVVCWDEDMRVWDGKPVEFDWERHYYTDRNSQLVHVKDLQL